LGRPTAPLSSIFYEQCVIGVDTYGTITWSSNSHTTVSDHWVSCSFRGFIKESSLYTNCNQHYKCVYHNTRLIQYSQREIHPPKINTHPTSD
jgi:hypothetical protein